MKKEIKCPRCRRRIQKEDAYCQYCGCHVAEEKKKKRKKKIRRFLVLVIVIVLFLGILLAIAVGSQKKQIQGWKERQLEEWKQKQEKQTSLYNKVCIFRFIFNEIGRASCRERVSSPV